MKKTNPALMANQMVSTADWEAVVSAASAGELIKAQTSSQRQWCVSHKDSTDDPLDNKTNSLKFLTNRLGNYRCNTMNSFRRG